MGCRKSVTSMSSEANSRRVRRSIMSSNANMTCVTVDVIDGCFCQLIQKSEWDSCDTFLGL